MWHSFTHNEKLENGDKVAIRVRFNDSKGYLYIDDVALTPKGKRKEIYVKGELTDEYPYRRLSIVDRNKAELKRFVEVASVEVLNNALVAAWEDFKPKLIDSEDYKIEY